MREEQKKNPRANRPDMIERLSIGSVFNNTSRVYADKSTGTFVKHGEPTEAALKVLADKLMGEPNDISSAFKYE